MAVIGESMRMSAAELVGRRCGEQHGRFYDRKGDYFREGVDPRNHVGRFVVRAKPHPCIVVYHDCAHAADCPANFSTTEPCNCHRHY